MITLLLNEISSSLKHYKPFKALQEAYAGGHFPLEVEGPIGVYKAFVLNTLLAKGDQQALIVLPTDAEAEELVADLASIGTQAAFFPSWGTLLYQGVSPQAGIFGQRVQTLMRLVSGQVKVVVTSLKALVFPLPPPAEFKTKLMTLKKGNTINVQKTAETLAAWGYMRVPRVSVPGEFALRGEVLDLYLQGDDQALRVVFEFDQIEELKKFDPLTQNSTAILKEYTVYPAREMHWTPEAIATLERRTGEIKGLGEGLAEALDSLKTTGSFRGEELFYPLAWDKPAALWDYFAPEAVMFSPEDDRLHSAVAALAKEDRELYKQAKRSGLTVPEPEQVFLPFEQFSRDRPRLVSFPQLRKQEVPKGGRFTLTCEAPRSFFGNIPFLKEEIQTALQYGYKIFVFAESDSQAQRLEFLLKDFPVKIIPHGISGGFNLPDQKITVIQENEIFGRRKKAPASLKKVQSQIIDSFVDLSPGDFVVHLNYGIGRFKGIDRIKAAGNERDYICLEYGGEETIFIPIEQVNLIQRYIGQEGREPKLDTIGGKSWESKKARVRKSVEDLADRLVLLYAKRQNATGFSFPKDNDWQVSFEASFPYQETEDQINAINDVKTDMESARPMDRLICGDVGYGKTEVAMRAAFKAVMGGKQVAFLAPTTILAEQHYENFSERFKRFPVKLGMLSRFVSKADQKKVLEDLAKGEIDLVIGTHRILQKDVVFKNLGLVMVDEEQRFGVKDKERMKEMKSTIDSLALSATPIPRTLHMSLLKIRDMSVLRTAPVNRQPIETFVQEFNEDLIAKAIRAEVERGGQVFFLHNRVETLEATMLYLQNLLPELLIRTAHGQMNPQDLEEVMHDFIHGNFHVLVSTTIVENGIDIPNVNTIIIDRADVYGISQLYQLRGRVGRSGKLAYAYLFYPKEKALTELAMKRLQVISDFTELGAGFKIAMKDLEVRGAGNLLGAEQSGDIVSVGFELYLRLLDEAVAARQNDKRDEWDEIYMELDYSGFIPDTYIAEATDKMEVYKKIASVVDEDDLGRVYQDIFDRFGPVPDEVHSLLSIAEIQIICRKLKIKSVRERAGQCTVEFGRMVDFPFEKAMRLLKESAGKVKTLPAKPNVLVLETSKVGLKEKSAFIKERLTQLL